MSRAYDALIFNVRRDNCVKFFVSHLRIADYAPNRIANRLVILKTKIEGVCFRSEAQEQMNWQTRLFGCLCCIKAVKHLACGCTSCVYSLYKCCIFCKWDSRWFTGIFIWFISKWTTFFPFSTLFVGESLDKAATHVLLALNWWAFVKYKGPHSYFFVSHDSCNQLDAWIALHPLQQCDHFRTFWFTDSSKITRTDMIRTSIIWYRHQKVQTLNWLFPH